MSPKTLAPTVEIVRPSPTRARQASPLRPVLARPAPVEPGAHPLRELGGELTVLGETPLLLLAEDGLGVQGDLEGALAAGLQLQPGQDRSVAGEDVGRLTDGSVKIVSRDTEFDRHPVLAVQHLSLLVPGYASTTSG